MNIIYLQQRLWQVSLQSGTGQLRDWANVDDQTHLDFVQYFTDALGYHMERYVLANALATVQLYFDARIALIKHTYTDRW